MGSCWSDASNDVAADKSVSGKDAITEADVKVVGAAKHSKYYKVHGKPKRKRMDKDTLLEMGIDPDFKRCVLESGHPSIME